MGSARIPRWTTALGLTLLIAACVSGTTVTEGGETGSLTGRLAGGVSAGDDSYDCAWLVSSDGEKIDVIYPVGWEVLHRPLRLIDPSGTLMATEGAIVRVTGPIGGTGESGCSEVMPFLADTVEVLTEPAPSVSPT